MQRYLAVYLGSSEAPAFEQWRAMPEAARSKRERSGMQAWMQWAERHAASIVVAGGPLGKTKRVDANGPADAKNAMCGYVVVEAESHAAAARLFEDHPHFSVFPGQAVEVMQCLPLPEEVGARKKPATATPRSARRRNPAKRSAAG